MNVLFRLLISSLILTLSFSTSADSLFDENTFKPYAADHRARLKGDSVTILIYEASSASSNADSESGRSLGAGLDFNSTSRTEFGNLDFDVSQESDKGTQRQGNLRAQITAVVEDIDQVGRLQVVGTQEIIVNGEKQLIKIRGWVRNVDITPANTVLSTRLSDASIEYKGDNLDGMEGRGGILRRVGEIVMWVPSKALDLTVWLLGVL